MPPMSMLIDAGKAIVAQAVVWVCCYMLVKDRPIYDTKKGTVLEDHKFREKIDAWDGVFCQPFFTLLAVLALQASYDLGGSVESRWKGQTDASYWFQIFYVTRMVVHTPLQFVTLKNNPKLLAQMTMHHVLSACSFGSGLMTGRMHFFAVFDGCCEVTTFFLNGLFLLRTYAPPDANAVPKALCGGFLWLTFIFFRLLLFPAWLYLFFSDVYAAPAITWDTIGSFERYGYVPVTVVLLLLSASWFVPITKGLIKAVKGASKKKKGE